MGHHRCGVSCCAFGRLQASSSWEEAHTDFIELKQSSSQAAPPAGCMLGLLSGGGTVCLHSAALCDDRCAPAVFAFCLGFFGVGWGCEVVKT